MEQQRNACPTRQGAGHLDETIGQGAVGYERAMIEFIQLWHRFGGGPARDIFVEFGLAEHEFFAEHSSCFRPAPSRESMRKRLSTSARCVGGGSRPFVVDHAVFASAAPWSPHVRVGASDRADEPVTKV